MEPTSTEPSAGGVDRPLNGVLARTKADALEIGSLRAWNAGLSDYMVRARLIAGVRAGARA
jgi:hypothetical protein